jgi:hypothetical protein
MRAVILIVGFALLAFQTSRNLSTNTHTITDLHTRLAVLANSNSSTNDLVADSKW